MMHFIHTNYGYCYYELDKPVPEGGTYLVYSLYVHKEFRRNGCAKRMLRHVIDEIRDTGYSGAIYIKAEPQEASIEVEHLREFYKSMGLTVT